MGVPILDEKFDDTPIVSIFGDIQLFLCSWFLFPCTLARVRAGIRGDKNGFNLIELLTSWLLAPCCIFKTRADMRAKYNKSLDSPILDQILSCWCCGICSLAQMATHMQKSNDLPPFKLTMG